MIRAFLKKVGILSPQKTPIVIPRASHGISRKSISENALKVLYRLNQKGYEAYLVGGGVRDLLLGLEPKDYDIATNAKPEEVRKIFRNCRLIGRRFRLAHVFFGHDIIEVATFRGKANASPDTLSHSEAGVILRDNVYGSMEEDAWRRDFTINALYYNIADFSIVDYTGGFADIRSKKIRMIGDVSQRFNEDPVRMLRAIRLACKTGFVLPKHLRESIRSLKDLISHVASARLFEEMIKLFHSGTATMGYKMLKDFDLFHYLFPATHESFSSVSFADKFICRVFENTDKRIQEGNHVTPAFVIAAMLWGPICARVASYKKEGMRLFPAKFAAIDEVMHQQSQRLPIPKRIQQKVRDIWVLQIRFQKQQGRAAQKLIEDPAFRAAYDFLELRAKAGEPVDGLFSWWKDYIESDQEARTLMEKKANQATARKRKRRRRNPRTTA